MRTRSRDTGRPDDEPVDCASSAALIVNTVAEPTADAVGDNDSLPGPMSVRVLVVGQSTAPLSRKHWPHPVSTYKTVSLLTVG